MNSEKITLFFIQKNVYGRILFYPVNKPAMAICSVAGQTTLKMEQLKTLSDQGEFNIEINAETVTFKPLTKA